VTDLRHRACDDIHTLLPDGWRVGPTSFDPGVVRWSITARSPKPGGRLRAPATLRGTGEHVLAVISKMLGHADDSTTVDVYSHLSTERSRVAASRIDAVLKARQIPA
jgi:integrase